MLDLVKNELHRPENYGKLKDIAAEAGVGYDWLIKVKTGDIPNPGINGVQALYETLFPVPRFLSMDDFEGSAPFPSKSQSPRPAR